MSLPPAPAPRISAVVHTLNEEVRLPYALRSLRPWVDEIVVVDMHSDDRTVAIARSFGAVVHEHARAGYADPARAFGVSKASGDWIFILDADEVVPPSLAARLRAAAEAGAYDVVRVPRANWIFGRVVRHAGWGPSQDGQFRLFRRGAVRVTPDIHNYLNPVAGARILDLCRGREPAIAHFNYVDVSDFLERLNRYTSIEAQAAAQRGERATGARLIRRPLEAFVWRYVRLGGWRDGWRGFALSALMGCYRLAAQVKLREIAEGPASDEVVRRYQAEAERLLAEPAPPASEAGARGPARG